MKILITGANGFIGHPLVQSLKNTEHQIYPLTHKEQDITKPFQLKESFDCVVHLAACNVTHIGQTDYEQYHRVNVLGTENVIKSVDTQHFIFISTALVYKKEGKDIDESSPIEPQGDYAKSKWEAEKVCQKYLGENKLTILRLVNVAGEGQAEKAVIPIFIKKALRNDPIELIYSPKTLLQFLYVKDLVSLLGELIARNKSYGVLNVAPEKGICLGALAEVIVRQTESSSEIKILNTDKAVNMKILATKVKQKIGWQVETSVEQIIKNYRKSLAFK